MSNIKELMISYDSEACSDWYPCNLGRFTKLETLKWCGSVQSFTLPSSLQELSLDWSSLDWEKIGVIVKSLPHLGQLYLGTVKGEEWSLAVEEEFPRLKIMAISRCEDLILWNANSSNFPVLEILNINWLPELSEIPFDFAEVATLEWITVVGCSVSAAVSATRIAVEQHSFGNRLRLQVHFKKEEQLETVQKLVEEEDLKTNTLNMYCGRT